MRPEDALHEAVVATAHASLLPGVYWFHVPNQSRANVAYRAKLKRMGVRAGVPDLVFIHHGCAHFIELKAGAGRQQPSQVAAMVAIRWAGGIYEICRSVEECQKLWKEWGMTK